MSTPPDESRRNPRSQQSILDAARSLTAEVGFAALTIEAIAARAGVGKQTIYRWWPSKGAVLFDAILAANSDPENLGALPNTGDLMADLRPVLRAVVAELADPGTDRLYRAVAAQIQTDESLGGELVRRLLGPSMQATAARLHAARDSGLVTIDADVEITVELLFGPVFHRWLLRTGDLNDVYADRVVTAVGLGLSVQ